MTAPLQLVTDHRCRRAGRRRPLRRFLRWIAPDLALLSLIGLAGAAIASLVT